LTGAFQGGMVARHENLRRVSLRITPRARFDLVLISSGLLRFRHHVSATTASVGLSNVAGGARCGLYRMWSDVPDFHAIHAVDRYWLIAKALARGCIPKSFVLRHGGCAGVAREADAQQSPALAN